MSRFEQAADLFEAGIEIQRLNLKRKNPDASEADVDSKLLEWLLHPSGAPFGDSAGNPGSLDRFK